MILEKIAASTRKRVEERKKSSSGKDKSSGGSYGEKYRLSFLPGFGSERYVLYL